MEDTADLNIKEALIDLRKRFDSNADLGRKLGITGARVGQLLEAEGPIKVHGSLRLQIESLRHALDSSP